MTLEERREVLECLRVAAADLAKKVDPRLIPDTGLAFGFALRGSRDETGVAAVTGGIRQNRLGACEFSADPAIARIIVTAIKFDPSIRSAAVVRCTPELYRVAENLFFEVCTFDPAREPPGISSMDWGVASCCRDGVPEVIASRSAVEKSALLRFLGANPEDVVTNIVKLSNRLISSEI